MFTAKVVFGASIGPINYSASSSNLVPGKAVTKCYGSRALNMVSGCWRKEPPALLTYLIRPSLR